MIVFEDIIFELFQLLVAKWTAMVTIYCLLDASFAIHVTATCYVTVVDWVKADCALELGL